MAAAAHVIQHDKPIEYPGAKDGIGDVEFDKYDFWSAWADETLYEFTNNGTECCPEYQYPDCGLFAMKPKAGAT